MFTLPVSFQTAVGVIVVLKVMAVEDDLAPDASRLVYLYLSISFLSSPLIRSNFRFSQENSVVLV